MRRGRKRRKIREAEGFLMESGLAVILFCLFATVCSDGLSINRNSNITTTTANGYSHKGQKKQSNEWFQTNSRTYTGLGWDVFVFVFTFCTHTNITKMDPSRRISHFGDLPYFLIFALFCRVVVVFVCVFLFCAPLLWFLQTRYAVSAQNKCFFFLIFLWHISHSHKTYVCFQSGQLIPQRIKKKKKRGGQ